MSTEKTPSKRWGAGRVAFRAIEDEVRSKVQAGWPLRAIYDEQLSQLRGLIGYPMFCRYVNRYITTPGGGCGGARGPPERQAPARAEIPAPRPSQADEDPKSTTQSFSVTSAQEGEKAPEAPRGVEALVDVDKFIGRPVDLDELMRQARALKRGRTS